MTREGLTRRNSLVTNIGMRVRADKQPFITRPHVRLTKMLKCAKPEGLAQLIDMARGFVVATHRAIEAWV
jgi:hypothetical protein